MATPPCFSDLGKKASDLLSKSFGVGQVKLEASSRAKNGSEFKVNGTAGNDGRVCGNFELKRKDPNCGLTLTEKWTTDNELNFTAAVEDKFVDGLKTTIDVCFAPASGKRSGKLKTAFKRPNVHTTTDFEVSDAGPTVKASFVLAGQPSCGWVGGYSGAYNTSKGQLTSSDFSLEYVAQDFTLHSTCKDYGAEFHSSLYQRVSSSLEAGWKMSWTSGSSTAQLQLGAKYRLQNGSTAGFRFNSQGILGLSYVAELSQGVEMTLAAQGDMTNPSGHGHRLGLGLNFSA